MCTRPLLKIRTNRINPKTNVYECAWLPKQYINKSIDEIRATWGIALIELPCGKCEECKQDQKRQIATRAFFAFKNNLNIYFITLTFKDDLEAQKAEKNPKEYLKKQMNIKDNEYLASFEHGKQTGRAHYHLIIELTENIKTAEKRWSKKIGFTKIESATPETIFYTANYTTKKEHNNDTVFFSRSFGKKAFLKELEQNQNIETIIIKGSTYSLPRYFKKLKEKYLNYDAEKKRIESEKKAQIKQKINNLKRSKNDNYKADEIAYNNAREREQKEAQKKSKNLYL